MSDGPSPNRGPLFPPRPEEASPPPPPPPPPPPQPPLLPPDLSLVSKVERAVVDTFSKHFGQSAMPYLQARILARCEMDVIGEVVRALLSKAPPPGG